jgi:hypothetical protein
MKSDHFYNAIFESSQRQLLALKSEWKSLGFWSRIWRAREFRIRLEVIMAVAERYDPRRRSA